MNHPFRASPFFASLGAMVLAGSLLLAGCNKVNDENYDKISNDMSRQQVERILGEGTDETSGGYGISSAGIATGNTGANDTTKTYSWKDGDKMIIVDFKDGKVVNKRKKGF